MSLTNALLDRIPPGEVYQSTSLVRNFRENRPEFPQITNPHRLRAVVGHWLHEAMLPVLHKPILFASAVRHPVERIRSQYRFDMGLRGERWRAESQEVFLDRNRNVIVNFVTRAFPTIAGHHPDPVEGCKAVLSGMDCLFDIADADHRIPELVAGVVGEQTPVARANESGGVEAELEFSDDEIAAFCDLDLQVWSWFSAARKVAPEARNPVFDGAVRDMFAGLGTRPFRPQVLADYLAPKLAKELLNDLENPRSAATRLADATDFALRTERAFNKIVPPGET